jgi:hypothetical protein
VSITGVWAVVDRADNQVRPPASADFRTMPRPACAAADDEDVRVAQSKGARSAPGTGWPPILVSAARKMRWTRARRSSRPSLGRPLGNVAHRRAVPAALRTDSAPQRSAPGARGARAGHPPGAPILNRTRSPSRAASTALSLRDALRAPRTVIFSGSIGTYRKDGQERPWPRCHINSPNGSRERSQGVMHVTFP